MIRGTLLRTLCLLLIIAMACPMVSGQVSSGKEKPVEDETGAYNLYFGDLHTHTGYSDAYDKESTPWQAYEAAIAAGADFMAVTDHIQLWNAYEAWIMDEEEWQDTLAAAEHYTSDEFVAMAGYEAWMLANCGEVNVYNIQELPERNPLLYRYDRLAKFYDWLADHPGAIGQFNHPLYVSENFMDYDYLSESRDSAMIIIEAFNEVYYEESYIMALDAGWHLMPSANSDTHYSDWIASHEMRSVLLAEELTPDHLYDAMRNCRGYATLDRNLEVYYTLNGEVMGSNLSDPGVTTYSASVQIYDPDGAGDEVTLVEIVSDGGAVVASMPADSTEVDLTFQIESDSARYFYVRITTASPLEGEAGVTAWTSPVWTGR